MPRGFSDACPSNSSEQNMPIEKPRRPQNHFDLPYNQPFPVGKYTPDPFRIETLANLFLGYMREAFCEKLADPFILGLVEPISFYKPQASRCDSSRDFRHTHNPRQGLLK